ncbi:unnamed protein product [Blepharisma stoltei]|uniref:Uncharacterized protein n=1 Tax=Blepharisma stoltei TaxID=1481888 RepID=A0AAU9JB61_9CILI|nr:unnamed protein product [Blepharisma stoltei]
MRQPIARLRLWLHVSAPWLKNWLCGTSKNYLWTKIRGFFKNQAASPNRENEIPDIIKFLKEEFLRLTRKTASRLEKGVFIAELKKNPLLAEVFGFDENSKEKEIEEQVENIGTEEWINMDEFLLFYQVSKSNLLNRFIQKQRPSQVRLMIPLWSRTNRELTIWAGLLKAAS